MHRGAYEPAWFVAVLLRSQQWEPCGLVLHGEWLLRCRVHREHNCRGRGLPRKWRLSTERCSGLTAGVEGDMWAKVKSRPMDSYT